MYHLHTYVNLSISNSMQFASIFDTTETLDSVKIGPDTKGDTFKGAKAVHLGPLNIIK